MIMNNNSKNRKVTRKIIMGEHGAFVSQIIEYDEPEDLGDNVKEYYPKNNKLQ